MPSLPDARPRLTEFALRHAMADAGYSVNETRFPVFVVAIRGYYRDTMGTPGVNDRGIFDDAICVVSPHTFAAFNGNTDPTRTRAKTAKMQGMATLIPGVYHAHTIGRHKLTYPALIQRKGVVRVMRDGDPVVDVGYFGINIHDAGTTTSSEGCLTIPRGDGQWKAFITLVVSEAERAHGAAYRDAVIPCVLLGEWLS